MEEKRENMEFNAVQNAGANATSQTPQYKEPDMMQKKEEIQKILELATPTEQDLKVQIKREDKKSIKKFILLMLASLIIGFFVGLFMAGTTDKIVLSGIEFRENMSRFNAKASYFAQYGLIVYTFLSFVVCLILRNAAKHRLAKLDQDNEAEIEKVDSILSAGIQVSGLLAIVGLILFGMSFYLADIDQISSDETRMTFEAILLIITFVVYILSLVISMVMQKKFVNMTKELYPEKRGSIYDTKFQQKWVDSCDEAEQIIIYKASYTAYIKLQSLLCVLTLIFACLGMAVEIGIFPIVLVGFITVYANISFVIASHKLERKK